MLAPSESARPSTESRTPDKTVELLRNRLRQLMRIALILLSCLTLVVGAVAIWWLTSLNNLPDIGDPFDVAALRARQLPDDQNAFVLIRRADRMLGDFPDLFSRVGFSAPMVGWSKADPKLRAWVDASSSALKLFQQAAELPGAVVNAAVPSTDVRPLCLAIVALMEGSKRQERGDMASAWGCYRAVIRTAAFTSGRGSLDQQLCVDFILKRNWLQQRVATWAADSRTTIPELRAALADLQQSEPRSEWDVYALQLEYLEIMKSLDRPMDRERQEEIEGEWIYRIGDMQVPAELIESFDSCRRFLLREPERSRRVIKLLWASYLNHVMSHDPSSRKPVLRVVLKAVRPTSVILYAPGADAQKGANSLSPPELGQWLLTARDAKLRIVSTYNKWLNGRLPLDRVYRRAYREMAVSLASEIYRRERGVSPPSDEALVGSYLKTLPDDGSADMPGESTPTID